MYVSNVGGHNGKGNTKSRCSLSGFPGGTAQLSGTAFTAKPADQSNLLLAFAATRRSRFPEQRTADELTSDRNDSLQPTCDWDDPI